MAAAVAMGLAKMRSHSEEFDEWTGVFGSEITAGALLDRRTHHVHILEVNGDSYRLNGSRQRPYSPSQVEKDGA